MLRISQLLNPEQTSVASTDSSSRPSPDPPSPCPSTRRMTKRQPHTRRSSARLTAAVPPPVQAAQPTAVARPVQAAQPAQVARQTTFEPFEIYTGRRSSIAFELGHLAHQHGLHHVALTDDKQGRIEDHRKTIPYSSTKLRFFEKTGRSQFDIYEYQFRLPAEPGTTYYVHWDREVGLVHITAFFKACKYGKIVPRKALIEPGKGANLSENICYRITGGVIKKYQGFWVPYACARAVCLTFCWPIRWVLTPLFGDSFVNQCIPPTHPNFGRFAIDAQLGRQAHLDAAEWRNNGGKFRQQVPAVLPPPPAGRHPYGTARRLPPTIVSDNSDESGQDSPAVSPKTIPLARSSAWNAINRHVDSSVMTGNNTPASDGLSPLSLPASGISPRAATAPAAETLVRAMKGKRKAPRRQAPAPGSLKDEDDDDLRYGNAEDYIIRSPSSSPLPSPPRKKAKVDGAEAVQSDAVASLSHNETAAVYEAAAALMMLARFL